MKDLDLIYVTARELPPEERPAYLTKACEGDNGLRRRVEQMLSLSNEAEAFIIDLPEAELEERKPGREAVKDLRPGIADMPDETVGQRIGRYKILEKVGEGGCGVVYVAEQTEPMRRRVALKVIKLGMDTKQVVARFEAERQALAMMDHPNIAKVLDAGATETGRPYFIMELVRGIKITDYCDQASLPTRKRLDLFIQVCQAIQHAHQKGIIHRDIKPSNILVTINDGVPVPKVIDFGIAKATEGRLTDLTVYTQLHHFIGTPAYMSPEQAEMSSLDIDTRSDIYSLGVLLYELLAGKTPFDAQELMSLGIDAMRKTIREKEPVRPSTRLATLQGDELTTAAKRRAVEAPRLIHLLKGDLDWIVMKCLEKDRTRRYETANGLAMDLTRHLRNEPVSARPPSQLYRFQKAARRNRAAFAGAAAVLVALAIGVVVSMAEAVQARHAREKALAEKVRADREAATARHVSGFLEQMLNSANPEDLKGSDYTVRQLLDDCSAGLSDQLASEPEVEATVRSTIGRAYQRLGAGEKAQKQFERALALRRQLLGDSDEKIAESQVDCAWALFEQEHFPAGETYAREGLRIYRERNARGRPFIYGLWVLQMILSAENRFADVDAVTAEALAFVAKTPGVEYPEIASMLHGQAAAKVKQEKYAEAEPLARQALTMHQRLRKPGDLETAWALATLGSAQVGEHKGSEAVTAFEQALAIFRKQYSPAHKSVGMVLENLRSALLDGGDYAGLEKLDLEILDWQRSVSNSSAASIAETLSSLVSAYSAQGKLADAEKLQTEAINIILGGGDGDISTLPAAALRQAAQFCLRQDHPARGEELFDSAIAKARKKLGETNAVLGQFFQAYGYFLWQDEGKFEAGASQFQKALSIQRATPNDALAETLRNLGAALRLAGKNPKEVENYEQESLDLYRTLHHADDPWGTALPTALLGRALTDEGKLAQGEKLCREGMAIAEQTQGIGKQAYNVMLGLLIETLTDEKKINEAIGLLGDRLARERKTRGDQDSEVISIEHDMIALLASPAAEGDLSKQKREALDFVSRLSANSLVNLRPGIVSGLQEAGLRVEAREFCRQIVNKYSTNDAILNNIAWELATGLSPAPEDAALAVEMAEKATALPAGQNANALDTLAGCYAAVGRFTNAVATEGEAIGMLTNNEAKDQFAERGKLYEAGLTCCDVDHLTKYVDDLLEVKRFAAAEPMARRNLAMRQILTSNDGQLFSAQTMLGLALCGEGKFGEAEPLLLAGYQGLKQRRDSIHFVVEKQMRNTLASLAKICEATNRRQQADQWRMELAKETQ